MEITELFAIIKRRIVTVIIIVILITSISIFTSTKKKDSYQTSTTITVQAKREATDQYQFSSFYAIQSSELFINTIIGWIRSTSFIADVYSRSGFDIDAEKINSLAKNIYTQKVPPQNISLIVSDENKEKSIEIAESIILTIKERISDLSRLDDSSTDFEINTSRLMTVPVKQNIPLNILVSLIASLFLAALIVFIKESLNPTINTRHSIKSIFGSLPLSLRRTKLEGLFHPESELSEKFRYIRSNLDIIKTENGSFGILVFDTEKNEKGSILASNIALSYSRSGKKTLIIDGNLENPTIHELWGVKNDKGLSETLLKDKGFTENIKKTEDSNLSIMTSGNKLPFASDIIERSNTRDMMNEIYKSFDVVIYNCHSPAHSSDYVPLMGLIKNSLALITIGKTKIKDAKYIAKILNKNSIKINCVTS